MKPQWFRRTMLIAFSWLAYIEICVYQKKSFKNYIAGMKVLWNL